MYINYYSLRIYIIHRYIMCMFMDSIILTIRYTYNTEILDLIVTTMLDDNWYIGYNREVYDPKYNNEKAIIVELGPEFDWDMPKSLGRIISSSNICLYLIDIILFLEILTSVLYLINQWNC